MHIDIVKVPGEVNEVDAGCFNCKPCKLEFSVWETNSSCTYTFSGGAAGTAGTQANPAEFTITNDCRNPEMANEVVFVFECGGATWPYTDIGVHCTDRGGCPIGATEQVVLVSSPSCLAGLGC